MKLSFESTSELMREKYDHSILPGEIIPPSEKKQPVVSVCVSGYKPFDFVIRSSGRRYYPLKHEKVFGSNFPCYNFSFIKYRINRFLEL